MDFADKGYVASVRGVTHRYGEVLALDFPYYQPQLRRGERPVPLVLYHESFDRVRRRLSTTAIRRLLYTIWRRIYRIRRPLSDPAFRRMMKALSTKRFIGPVQVAALPVRRGRH